jgi:uncharacterized protein with HEPN domain
MKRHTRLYLEHLLEAAKKVARFTSELDEAHFTTSALHQSAIVRELLVIGKATKRLPEDFRDAHPELPWRQLAGMRDFLIHSYDQVNPDVILETATQNVPTLISRLESILEESSRGWER